MITMDQLRAVMPHAGDRLSTFLEPLNAAMIEFGVHTPKQIAAFLGQIAHESGECRFTEEIASGHDYEGRHDLGNTEPGDGPKFKGRGLMQITGRRNYGQCGTALGLDLVRDPTQLATPLQAARSAAWFWSTRGLNDLANQDNYAAITRIINGGYTALDARIKYWLAARRALGVQ